MTGRCASTGGIVAQKKHFVPSCSTQRGHRRRALPPHLTPFATTLHRKKVILPTPFCTAHPANAMTMTPKQKIDRTNATSFLTAARHFPVFLARARLKQVPPRLRWVSFNAKEGRGCGGGGGEEGQEQGRRVDSASPVFILHLGSSRRLQPHSNSTLFDTSIRDKLPLKVQLVKLTRKRNVMIDWRLLPRPRIKIEKLPQEHADVGKNIFFYFIFKC